MLTRNFSFFYRPLLFSFRKRSLLRHLNATKQRLHRLQILLQWCHKASAVAECKRVLEVSSTHANAFRDAADQLVYLHGELIHSKAPVYDVPTAIHVLSSGGYAALPSVIESELKVVAPGKGKSTASNNSTPTPDQLEKGKAALRRLDFLIRSKLLEEGLPTGMRVERISNGEVVVSSTSEQYIATISLVPAPSTEATLAKWTPPEGTLDLIPADQEQEQNQETAQPIKQEEKKIGEYEKQDREVKIEAMDIDKATENADIERNNEDRDSTIKLPVSEASQWRWRLLSLQLLPTHPPALLPPHLVPWLIRNVEDRMWAASDIQQLIHVGKSGLVVVPPPPMTRKQREQEQKEIDEKGREGLLPSSLSVSRSLSAQQPSGSLSTIGRAMSGISEQITSTTGAGDGDGSAEAGSPGVIPIWAQSPLAALHAVLQHTSAKLAIGSVLMEEARALESGLLGATTTKVTSGGGTSGWSHGNLRISKLENRFGVRFTLWPRVPLLSTSELTGILLDGHNSHDGGVDDDGQGTQKDGKVKKEEKLKKEGKIHPSLGWILQVEVPPPTYEADVKKTEKKVAANDTAEVNKKEEMKKKKEESTSDGTITCVCVPPLRDPESLKENKSISLSVWSDDGSLSTENLLLRASAQHAQMQLAALHSLMTKQSSETKHAQHLDEVLGENTWHVDLVDTRGSRSRTRAVPAMPALQCSFNTHAMLLLHFRPTDGQPILSLGPFLTEAGVELASESENIVKKAQIALNKRLEAVLTEVLPTGITRALLWMTTITEALVESWKHLVALQRREEMLEEGLGYGFGRAVLPRCIEGAELVSFNGGNKSPGSGDANLSAGGGGSGGGNGDGVFASKETTAVLRAPYFTSPTLSSSLKESIPTGKQGSLVCYLLADVTSAAAVATSENFEIQMRLALCWATPGGVPTGIRRILPVLTGLSIPSQTSTGKGTSDVKLTPPQQKGGGKATTSAKRKRQDQVNDEDATKVSLPNITDFSGCLRGINWKQLTQWCVAIISVQQLEAQLEAAEYKAEPTEDKTAVRVSLSTIPWLSASMSSPFLKFTDEEIQFSLDPGRMSFPEEGAFLTTFSGEKFSLWRNELEKHGLANLIKIECGAEKEETATQEEGEERRQASFEIKEKSGSSKEKLVVRCMLKDGKFSAGEMVTKAISVGATTAYAANLSTALQEAQQKQGQGEEARYIVSIHSVDLDKITLHHTDSRGIGDSISITVQWSAYRGGKNVVNDTAVGVVAPAAAGIGAGPSSRRLMTVGSAPILSQPVDNYIIQEGKDTTEARSNNPLVCCVSSSPPVPRPLLVYLENQLSVENSFEAASTFLSVLTSVAASAAVIQAVALDPVAQHAAGLLPGALTVEMFSFQPATASAAAAVSAAAAAGVCRLVVHQRGRSLQLQMVFQSSGAVMLRARQLPSTRDQQPAGGAHEEAWLQEAWSRIALQTSVTATTTSGSSGQYNHILVTLLPEQLGPVLTSLLHSVGRKE